MLLNAFSKSFGSDEAPTSLAMSLKRVWRSASVSLVFLGCDLRGMSGQYHLRKIQRNLLAVIALEFTVFPCAGINERFRCSIKIIHQMRLVARPYFDLGGHYRKIAGNVSEQLSARKSASFCGLQISPFRCHVRHSEITALGSARMRAAKRQIEPDRRTSRHRLCIRVYDGNLTKPPLGHTVESRLSNHNNELAFLKGNLSGTVQIQAPHRKIRAPIFNREGE